MVIEHFFDSRDELFDALTTFSKETLEHGALSNQSCSFMVSGGSTPAPLYERLSHVQLPWQKVKVALVDERWVDTESSSSNQRFIESTLMKNNAKAASLIGMKNSSGTAEQGLAATTEAYQSIGEHFDLTILGMGNDGHTASLFPHSQGLEQALKTDACAKLSAIIANKSEVTGDNLERMTLSLAGLLKSRHLVLLITGQAKLDVYRKAQENQDFAAMPMSAVLHQQRVPVHVYWAA